MRTAGREKRSSDREEEEEVEDYLRDCQIGCQGRTNEQFTVRTALYISPDAIIFSLGCGHKFITTIISHTHILYANPEEFKRCS